MYGHCQEVPGEKTSLKKKVLGVGASMLQNFGPVNNICEHVSGIHFYNGRMNEQVLAHHYCSVLNEDFRQCLIYESNEKTARLIGVEYIISEKLFKTLSDEEARYWHSHVYEVKSGMLSCPNIPQVAEKEVMKELICTYGKTIHLWQIDKGDKIPLGPPQVMMAFTSDNQVNLDLLKLKDQQDGSNYEDKKKERADIPEPALDPRADRWEKTGKAIQLDVKEVQMKQFS